jgi:hypothetical protein
VKAAGKFIGGLFGGKDKGKEDGKPDERTDEQKRQDLQKAVSKVTGLMDQKNATVTTVTAKLPQVIKEFRLKSLELVKDRDGYYHVEGQASPLLTGPMIAIWDGILPEEVKAAAAQAAAARDRAVKKAAEINADIQKRAQDIRERKKQGKRLTRGQEDFLLVAEGNKVVAYSGNNFCVSGYSRTANALGAALHDRLMKRMASLMGELQALDQRELEERFHQTKYIPESEEKYDRGLDASFVLSHAEKYAILEYGGKSIGVSQSMCDDCQGYFAALAEKRQDYIVVAEPGGIKVFLKDKRLTF